MNKSDIETTVILKDIEVDGDVHAAFWKLVNAGRRGGKEEQRGRVSQAIDQLMREHIHRHLKRVERASRNAGQAAPPGSIAAALTNLADVFPEFDAMLREDMGLNRWPLDKDATPQTLRQAVAQVQARGVKQGQQDAQDMARLQARDAAWRQGQGKPMETCDE